MTKREFAEKLRETFPSLSTREAVRTLNTVCDIAAAELLGGGVVPLARLGKLKVKPLPPRQGRNPRTGEIVDLPAGKRVKFCPSQEFKEALTR